MIMSPARCRFALTVHVLASVGWLGAVASFLALAIAGLANQDAQIVRAAYLAMEVLTGTVIVPLAFGSLLTGLAQALRTPWGLFRHYWVLFKLALTLLATILLLVHTQPIHHVADAAASTLLAATHLRQTRIQLVVDAAEGWPSHRRGLYAKRRGANQLPTPVEATSSQVKKGVPR